MKTIITFILLLFSTISLAQRPLKSGEMNPTLTVVVYDIVGQKKIDTFSLVIKNGQEVYNFNYSMNGCALKFDASGKYIVRISSQNLLDAEFNWDYEKEKDNRRYLTVYLYPQDMSERKRHKALKKYYQYRNKNNPRGTSVGLHWEYEEIVSSKTI